MRNMNPAAWSCSPEIGLKLATMARSSYSASARAMAGNSASPVWHRVLGSVGASASDLTSQAPLKTSDPGGGLPDGSSSKFQVSCVENTTGSELPWEPDRPPPHPAKQSASAKTVSTKHQALDPLWTARTHLKIDNIYPRSDVCTRPTTRGRSPLFTLLPRRRVLGN